MSEPVFVEPDKLVVGMFVCLDLSWMEHPFAFNSFVIQTAEQLATLRGLQLKRVRIDPLRSKVVFPAPAAPVPAAVPAAPVAAPTASVNPVKLARIEQNRALRTNIARAERRAAQAAQLVRQATRQFFSEPGKAIAGTNKVVADIAESLLGDSETMIHLLNDKVAGEEIYYHSLNVAMLAMILGKAMGYGPEILQTIGVGAIFHDIGKEEIPTRVRLKTEPLTQAETNLLRQHCEFGATLATQGGLPDAVIATIRQHHENLDGSGYPLGLAGDQLDPAVRVIAVVNHYDNLCNPVNPANALTPYESLSLMFAKRKAWFDAAMLGKLVKVLGVYPPGSLVRLSNGATGMVISVNSARPLQPLVLVHDAAIPKEEALIVDLEKSPELSISKALRPAALAPSVYAYLSPRKRVTYYFGDDKRGP